MPSRAAELVAFPLQNYYKIVNACRPAARCGWVPKGEAFFEVVFSLAVVLMLRCSNCMSAARAAASVALEPSLLPLVKPS